MQKAFFRCVQVVNVCGLCVCRDALYLVDQELVEIPEEAAARFGALAKELNLSENCLRWVWRQAWLGGSYTPQRAAVGCGPAMFLFHRLVVVVRRVPPRVVYPQGQSVPGLLVCNPLVPVPGVPAACTSTTVLVGLLNNSFGQAVCLTLHCFVYRNA